MQVLLIALSVVSWNAACILMCHSGVTSCAVTNTLRHCSGTSGKSMWPSSATRLTNSSEYHPSRFAIATKSSLTSGISTPAWLRMNATANNGSMPEEHPAMIEIVPVGATVVRLQCRSRLSGRMRCPSASRAQVSSGPQMLRSHSGNTPRSCARRSLSTLDSSSTNFISRCAHSVESSEL